MTTVFIGLVSALGIQAPAEAHGLNQPTLGGLSYMMSDLIVVSRSAR
jgi:hypothetical protein